MLVGHAVSNYEGSSASNYEGRSTSNYEERSAFAESTDTSQLVESMTGQCICISLRLSKT